MELTPNVNIDISNNFKERLYDKLGEMRHFQMQISEMINEYHKTLRLPEENISYTANLVSNKISEFSNMFNKAGISFYYSVVPEINVQVASDIGDAITFDLLEKLNTSTDYLHEYVELLSKIVEQVNIRLEAEMKFIPRLKRLITFNNVIEVVTEEEKTVLRESLRKYVEISDEIWRYNLEDNLIPAFVNHIPRVTGDYYNSLFIDRVKECVIPELRKLNLERLIDPLVDEIVKYFEKLEQDSVTESVEKHSFDSEYSFEEVDELLGSVSDLIEKSNDILSEVEDSEEIRHVK